MRSLFGPGRDPQDRLIETLCRESGRWMVASREAGEYSVRAIDDRTCVRYIQLRASPAFASVVFQLFFPVRFSLQNPPSGLFGRLLVRNFKLFYAAWAMDVVGSCEAGIQLGARLPRQGIDARLFDAVCRELVDEADDFNNELREKLRFGSGGVMPARVTGDDGLGVPEVRFVGPVEVNTVLASRNRRPERRG